MGARVLDVQGRRGHVVESRVPVDVDITIGPGRDPEVVEGALEVFRVV